MAEADSGTLARRDATDGCDLGSLLAWDCDLVIPDAEYARMAVHPALTESLYRLCESNLAATEADTTLMGIFKDGGRYACAMWAIYLHVRGGLSLQSLKALCAQSGLLSPGRARAVLLYMRYLGFIEPSHERTSPATYVPTPRCRAAWTTHMCLALDATRAIEPAAAAVIERIGDPAVFASVVRTQGESLFNGARRHDLDTPLFKVFLNRHAGTLILSSLILTGERSDYPPAVVTPPAAGDLGQRFQVSRIQVRRILTEAVNQGLMRRDALGGYVLSDTFRADLRYAHAQQVRHLMLSVARAARLLLATTVEQI